MLIKVWQGVLYPICIHLVGSMLGKIMSDMFPNYVDLTTAVGISSIVTLIMLYIYAKNNKRLKVNVCFNNEKKFDVREMIYIIPIAFSFSIFYNVLVDITKINEMFPRGAIVSETLFDTNITVIILVVMILAPMVEEVIFRGFIYKSINGYGGKIIASVISALFFGLMHGNVSQGLFAFIATFLFIYIYEKIGNIFSSIFTHIVVNATGAFFGSCELYYINMKIMHKILLMIISVFLFIISMYRFRENIKMEKNYEEK